MSPMIQSQPERRLQMMAQLSRLLPRLGLLLLCLIGLFSLTLPVLAANPGDLDPSFGNGGVITTTLFSTATARAVAIQSDGKIIMFGNSQANAFALSRHNSDDSLDSGFGNGGGVTTTIGSNISSGEDVAIQLDGKIVVIGFSSNGGPPYTFALARYNNNGSLDSNFGKGGIVTTTIGTYAFGFAVAIQPDGKIIVAGNSSIGGWISFALARYKSNGSLDSSFGSSGIVTTSFGHNDHGGAVVIQSDGKIVVGGIHSAGGEDSFALARYNSNGSLDSSFGSSGIVINPVGKLATHGDIAIQSDGKIIFIGASSTNDVSLHFNATLARYNVNGSLDSGFGNSGIVTTSIGSDIFGNAIAIQPDGKIVVIGGSYYNNQFVTSALARYTITGSLDSNFGTDGIVTTTVDLSSDGSDIAIQPDGKIVAAGSSYDGSQGRFTLARYFGDSTNLTRQVYLPVVLKQ